MQGKAWKLCHFCAHKCFPNLTFLLKSPIDISACLNKLNVFVHSSQMFWEGYTPGEPFEQEQLPTSMTVSYGVSKKYVIKHANPDTLCPSVFTMAFLYDLHPQGTLEQQHPVHPQPGRLTVMVHPAGWKLARSLGTGWSGRFRTPSLFKKETKTSDVVILGLVWYLYIDLERICMFPNVIANVFVVYS